MRVRRTPQRSCIACRTARDQRSLLRMVRQPDGVLRLDLRGRLAGRGAYVCAEAGCVRRGLRAKLLDRAFRQPTTPAAVAALEAEVWEHLRAMGPGAQVENGGGSPTLKQKGS